MDALLLDLLGLLGVIVLTLLGAWAGFALLARLLWRAGQKNITACAARIAETLALSPVASPDARMLLWHGSIPGGELWLATGASHAGPTDLPFDPAGPGFNDGMPRVTFQHLCNILLVVRHARVLPVAFTASSSYGVGAGFRTGDMRFDQCYKLNAADEGRVQQLFADATLRDDLLGIFDPDCRSTRLMPRFGWERKRDGTDVVLSMNEQGMVVYWSSPQEKFAADFGLAVAKAVSALANARVPA